MRGVGIVGRKRSGKDTLAGALVAHHGYTRTAFGDAVKTVVLAANPAVADIVAAHGWEHAKSHPPVRAILQNLGMAVRDTLGSDAWIRAWSTTARTASGPLVVSDVRFPDEAAHLRDRGFLLVRVHRPGLDRSDPHISEAGSDHITTDLTVTNGGTLDHVAVLAAHIAEAAT